MQTINAQITKKEKDEGIGRTGKPYVRYVFELNQKKYSTFDKDIGDNFNVGDFVEMSGEQGDKYFNMKSMRKVDNTKPTNLKEKTFNTDDELRQQLKNLQRGFVELNLEVVQLREKVRVLELSPDEKQAEEANLKHERVQEVANGDN
jgi:hypothetical protein